MQGQCQRWASPCAWHPFLTTRQQTEWVVSAKPPLAGPQAVRRSLARSTHRVAITNRRLLTSTDGQVTFRWQDSQRGNRPRTMTLEAVACLRRFLLHVLPRGCKRMRHDGLFAHGVRKVTLPLCRRILGQAARPSTDVRAAGDLAQPGPPRPSRSEGCPVCHVGRMQVQDTWCAQRTARDLARPVLVWDTS